MMLFGIMVGILLRFIVIAAAFWSMAETAEAKRVALVIGQNLYKNLKPLDNPVSDAKRLARLLAGNGFEVLSCDGAIPGCFNQARKGLAAALVTLKSKAKDADLALVFYAGHGLVSGDANILVPTDAKIDCATMAANDGILVEHFLAAATTAKRTIVILDACRDQPLGKICPPLPLGKSASFKKIEAGEARHLLLVTSTQFGQQALDGTKGAHSPFAAALFAALETNPRVYFDQVLNQVAKDTIEAAQKVNFNQIPGRVVGGEAPQDCLAGSGCIGDARMAAVGPFMTIMAWDNAIDTHDSKFYKFIENNEHSVVKINGYAIDEAVTSVNNGKCVIGHTDSGGMGTDYIIDCYRQAGKWKINGFFTQNEWIFTRGHMEIVFERVPDGKVLLQNTGVVPFLQH